MGTGSAGKKCPREMVNIQAPLPPGSRMVHPDEQETGQRGKRPAWMNKEHLSKFTKVGHIQDIEAGTGHLE